MGQEPSRRHEDLHTVIVGGLCLSILLALSTNMLGGGWLGAATVFIGVNVCAWWLARRVDRYYDRIRRSDDRSS